MSTIKKAVRLALIGLGLFALGGTAKVIAAPTDTINVLVTVDVVSISITSATWSVGQVTPGSTNISPGMLVQNDGNRQEDFSMALTYAGSWTINTSSGVGSNLFALMGMFTTTPEGSITNGMFGETDGNDDVIDGSDTGGSATMYARTAEADSAKGFNIAASGTRTLFLNFRAPSANTVSAQQSMTVTVTATAG